MPAVAMTDHGNLYGAIEFYKACKSNNIKAIFGCEVNLAPLSIEDKREIVGRKRSTHITLLARDLEGWNNLSKLVSKSHLDGQYMGEPRVDFSLLAEYSRGITCLTGCANGPIHEQILSGNLTQAREILEKLVRIYSPEHTWIELQRHNLDEQIKCEPHLLQFAQDLNLRYVATNDVHFLKPSEAEAHDIMICIGEGKQQIDVQRRHYPESVYFKSAQEMRELFHDLPDACDNTLLIAEQCNVTLKLDSTSSEKYPQFPTPDGSPREEYFSRLCQEKLIARYGKERAQSQELQDRITYEIQTINQLGFASYFLITADFIQWARDNDIPVGPGRGSAAGSLVAYSLGITDICPLRFGLLFERFLNPERVSPPDVDIDFCQSRRAEVIQYVREKYSEHNVAHIITYGKMAAKSVIRDVGRVKGMSYGDVDRISKMIDSKPGTTLASSWGDEAVAPLTPAQLDLRQVINNSSDYQDLWKYACMLEGTSRSVGVHAAGVVIGDRPLYEHAPLTRGNQGEVVTQYDMKAITDVGLLKMDFLGLKNLTVIHDSIRHIRKHTPDFSLEKIPLDDPKTFDLLNRGDTLGVFQLESGGMVETCRKYHIQNIDEIIDLIAVYRPGAMQFIDQMLDVKLGRKEAVYEHPLLRQVCENTNGVMIYQEQVQNAAKLLAGYTLGGADLLRRAMGKKDKDEMARQKAIFVDGCAKTNNIPQKLAEQIFDKIETFAGYGFNKSHSACYGHISYWTAYLKANHPVEFLAALLSGEVDKTEKISVFIAECYRMKIDILPPDINRSELLFSPELQPNGRWAIRYGLAAIKNVGEAAMQSALAERAKNGPFQSIDDFAIRLDSKSVNKKILENLVYCGAMDWNSENRASMFDRIEHINAAATSAQRERDSDQVSMFDTEDVLSLPSSKSTTDIPEFSKDVRLTKEMELLGYYVSGHPLDKFRNIIDHPKFTRLGLVDEIPEDELSSKNTRFTFAGMITNSISKYTKTGKSFEVITFEDFTGRQEITFWGDSPQDFPQNSNQTQKSRPPRFDLKLAKEQGLLNKETVVQIKASIRVVEQFGEEGKFQRRITGYEIQPLELKQNSRKKFLELALRSNLHTPNDLQRIREFLLQSPGKTPVKLHIQTTANSRISLDLSDAYLVKVTDELLHILTPWLEENS